MCTKEEFFEVWYKEKYKQQGLEEGRAEGRWEEKIDNIKNMLSATTFSLEEVMDILKLNEEEKAKCKALLTN